MNSIDEAIVHCAVWRPGKAKDLIAIVESPLVSEWLMRRVERPDDDPLRTAFEVEARHASKLVLDRLADPLAWDHTEYLQLVPFVRSAMARRPRLDPYPMLVDQCIAVNEDWCREQMSGEITPEILQLVQKRRQSLAELRAARDRQLLKDRHGYDAVALADVFEHAKRRIAEDPPIESVVWERQAKIMALIGGV